MRYHIKAHLAGVVLALLSLGVIVCLFFWSTAGSLHSHADHVLNRAWDAADGIMEMSIDVKQELLLVHDLLDHRPRADYQAQAKILGEEIAEARQRIQQNMGRFDPQLAAQIDQLANKYVVAFETVMASNQAYDQVRSAFKVQSTSLLALLTTMDEFGDFNLESAVDDLENSQDLVRRWTAADGTMHMLIGLLRQFYYLERYFSEGMSPDMLSAVDQARRYQENAARRVISSNAMEVLSLGDFEEKDLAAAYQDIYRDYVRLLRETISNFEMLQRHMAEFREISQNLLDHLERAEAVADAAVEGFRSPVAFLGRMNAGGLWAALALLLIASAWSWRSLRNGIALPTIRLGDGLARLESGQIAVIAPDKDSDAEIHDLAETISSLHGRLRNRLAEQSSRIDLLEPILTQMPDMLLATDNELRITYASSAFERTMGYRDEEWRLLPLEEMVTSQSMRVLREIKEKTLTCQTERKSGQSGWPCLLEILARDQRSLFVECTVSPAHDKEGEPGGFILAMRDVSSIRDEREERSLLHAAMSETSEAILILEGLSHALYANPSFTRIFGLGKDEFVRRLNTSPDGEAEEPFPTLREAIAEGGGWNGQVEIHQGKNLRHLAVQTTPVRGVTSNEPIFLILAWDITAAVQSERDLRQAQKMQAVGTLAGGIAHDFNNLLVPILMNAEILSLAKEPIGGDDSRIREIVSAATRARELVRQILTFSKGGETALSPIRLDEVIEEAALFCRGALPSNITSELKLRSRGRMLGNRTQILQVLLNLCANAKTAMAGKGGMLEIELDEVDLGPGNGGEPSLFLRLTISDTGSGMDEGELERIFDPFYTTGATGVNTGLGLTIVHSIIEAHGGRIQIKSRPGQGTSIQILFPAIAPGEEPPAPSTDASEEARDALSGKVLVVDDDATNLSAISNLLRIAGLNVVSSQDPHEALELVGEQPGRFDLVASDLAMPDMSGMELARKLRELRPGLPILFISGNPARYEKGVADLGNAQILIKPFELQDIVRTLEEMLPGNQRK